MSAGLGLASGIAACPSIGVKLEAGWRCFWRKRVYLRFPEDRTEPAAEEKGKATSVCSRLLTCGMPNHSAYLIKGNGYLSSSTLLASASNCCSISGSASRPRAYLAPSLSGCFQRQLL